MGATVPIRDAEALQYRAMGWTYERIANEMGYTNASGARKAVQRAMARSWREPTDEAKTLVLTDLHRLKAEAWKVLETNHVVISQGRVVRRPNGTDEDGEPVFTEIPDDGPVLEAIDRLLKINQEIAKIMGLYAPTKTEHTHITLDTIDAEIQALEAALEAHDA